jgi:sensor histidine kinase regulating citrate/malate metabolism
MNAIDAMRAVEPRVLSVKSELTRRDSVQVSIADTGIGIDPANATKSLSRCLRPKNMAWGWVFPSAIRSSRTTAVEFGHRRRSTKAFQFDLPISREVA